MSRWNDTVYTAWFYNSYRVWASPNMCIGNLGICNLSKIMISVVYRLDSFFIFTVHISYDPMHGLWTMSISYCILPSCPSDICMEY